MKLLKYIPCCLFLLGLVFTSCGSVSENKNVSPPKDSTAETTSLAENDNQTDSQRYRTGDQLYVFAESGLVLREKPDISAAKVMSVPFAAPVKVIDEAPFQVAFSVKEPCGLPINGFWVKANYEGKQGYLFDGYLLAYRPKVEISASDYWAEVSKVKSSTDKAPDNDVNYYSYVKTTWENGVVYESSGYEGGSNATTTLPKEMFTFQEAYLFTMAQLDVDPENKTTCTCNVAQQVLTCESDDGLSLMVMGADANGNWEISDSYAD